MTSSNSISNRQRTWIFLSLVTACVFTSFLSTAMTTALPSVIRDLGISVSKGQWLTSGYSLVMGIVMPLTAFLIRRFDSRKLFLISLIIFVLGSLLCVVTDFFTAIMLGRLLQALANGLIMALTQVVLLTIYPKEKQGTIMGWYGLAVMTAPIVAPTLSGIIVDALGWRWIFYIIAGIMIGEVILASFTYKNSLEVCNDSFDISSFMLSILTFGGLTLGLGNISSVGISNPAVLVELITGLIAGILFVRRQLNLEAPFLDVKILKNKNFAIAVILSVILYFTMMGSSVILPLYFQNIMMLSATSSGLLSLPGSLVSALFSPVAGKMYDKMGIKRLLTLGGILMVISNIGMTMITMGTSVVVASLLNCVRCLAISIMMMPLVTWGIGSLSDSSKNAHGTALLTALRTVAGAIGSAVFVGIMNSVADASTAIYGSSAAIYGLHCAFIGMTMVAVLLLFIGIFAVKGDKQGAIL